MPSRPDPRTPVPLPCEHCNDQTRIPDTIRLVTSPGILMVACFYCRAALSWDIVSALGGIPIRSQKMANVANGVLDARPPSADSSPASERQPLKKHKKARTH